MDIFKPIIEVYNYTISIVRVSKAMGMPDKTE